MTWLVTANADELDLRVPQPQHITVWAIAWSLGQIVRFNGHALRPYSVAEHSLLVCEIAERELLAGKLPFIIVRHMPDGTTQHLRLCRPVT